MFFTVIIILLYHYTNLTVVRLSVRPSVRPSVTGRSTEAIRPARKSFVSLRRLTWTLHQAAHWQPSDGTSRRLK